MCVLDKEVTVKVCYLPGSGLGSRTFWKNFYHWEIQENALTLLVGQQEGRPACKNQVLVC